MRLRGESAGTNLEMSMRTPAMTCAQAQAFLGRPVVEVARDLIGCRLRRGEVELRISEVEAYAGSSDTASHARFGKTARNSIMWGPAGRIYMYLCYGVHEMLNLVTGIEHEASAVLIRGCETLTGGELVSSRRGGKTGRDLLAGPGKVAQALALDRSWTGRKIGARAGLQLLARAEGACSIVCGPRVGIDFAAQSDRRAPWRFAAAGAGGVSHRRLLFK